jgi:hypothetical protein
VLEAGLWATRSQRLALPRIDTSASKAVSARDAIRERWSARAWVAGAARRSRVASPEPTCREKVGYPHDLSSAGYRG